MLDNAERTTFEAIILYDELGLGTEKARTTWALASVVVKRGDLATGEARLDTARHELQRLGLSSQTRPRDILEWAEVASHGKPEGVAAAW